MGRRRRRVARGLNQRVHSLLHHNGHSLAVHCHAHAPILCPTAKPIKTSVERCDCTHPHPGPTGRPLLTWRRWFVGSLSGHTFVTAMVKGDSSANTDGKGEWPPCPCPWPRTTAAASVWRRPCFLGRPRLGTRPTPAAAARTLSLALALSLSLALAWDVEAAWRSARLQSAAAHHGRHGRRARAAGRWAIKGGDASAGNLTVYWDGARPVSCHRTPPPPPLPRLSARHACKPAHHRTTPPLLTPRWSARHACKHAHHGRRAPTPTPASATGATLVHVPRVQICSPRVHICSPNVLTLANLLTTRAHLLPKCAHACKSAHHGRRACAGGVALQTLECLHTALGKQHGRTHEEAG